MRRAVFLDRDGVLNRAILRDGKPHPPATLDELRLLAGVRDACRKLREAGFALILTTNQPDIARGATTAGQVAEINQRLQHYLGLDDVRVCPHDDTAHCSCRKPRPGLLIDAARWWNIDLASSFMVGDRWRDVEAGRQAGCRTVWIDRGYREKAPPHAPDYRAGTLRETVEWIKWITQCAGSRLAEG